MKKLQFVIFLISILIHISFYISAYFTHTLDIFFEHVTIGQDFFQIPNAAYAFLHGGTLDGQLPQGIPPYIDCCGVNFNVYHPLFTLLIGVPLQLFLPWIAFSIWAGLHFLTTLILLIIIWRKFKHHKWVYLALSFFLLNSYQYYEIQHAQYHFLLSLFTLLFLLEVAKKDSIKGGILYFLALFVKPIGLLWFMPLLLYKKFKVVLFGIGLYSLASLPFIFNSYGKFFFDNLKFVSSTPIASYNLFAITNVFPAIPIENLRYISIIVFIFLIFLQVTKKLPVFSSIFIWISFQLIFYSLVFHYHYSILAGLISLGILMDIFSIKKIEVLPIIMLTIPTPIIFFHLAGDPAILPKNHLSLIALWSIFWLLMLNVLIILPILKKKGTVSLSGLNNTI